MNAHAIIKSPQYFKYGRDFEEAEPKPQEAASRKAIAIKAGCSE